MQCTGAGILKLYDVITAMVKVAKEKQKEGTAALEVEARAGGGAKHQEELLQGKKGIASCVIIRSSTQSDFGPKVFSQSLVSK